MIYKFWNYIIYMIIWLRGIVTKHDKKQYLLEIFH